MSKNQRAIALYFGVFSIAYAGFFYVEYASRQAMQEINLASESSFQTRNTANTALETTATDITTSKVLSTMRVNDKQAHKPDDFEINSAIISTDASMLSQNTVSLIPENNNLQKSLISDRNSTKAEAIKYSVPKLAFNTSNTITALSTGTGTSTINKNSSSKTTEYLSSETPKSTASSNIVVSDNQDTTATIPNEDEDEDDTATSSTEAEELRMATPDCPYQLAEGSNEDYAKQMTIAYGCRYRNACTNINDGTGTYRCRWQYI